MALSIQALATWRINDMPQEPKTASVISLGSGDSTTVWNMLSDKTENQLGVGEFMKKVKRSGKISLFMQSDVALVTFPQGRKLEFLELRIKSNNIPVAEPHSRDLKVMTNVRWTTPEGPVVKENRVSLERVPIGRINVVVLELPKKGEFKL